MGQAPDFKETFLLEEFKACRDRISKEIEAINSLEITFILTTGAIIAFVSTQNIVWFRLGALVVFALGAYGKWRYDAHRKIIRIHETYIIDYLEPIAIRGENISGLYGMVKYYDENKHKDISCIGNNANSGSLKHARFFVWWALMGLSGLSLLVSICNSTIFGLITK